MTTLAMVIVCVVSFAAGLRIGRDLGRIERARDEKRYLEGGGKQ